MTAPLRSSQLPASQTAPVAEFRCLYTPDVRKKQKKWQDGYLKFHSFNNRVMVYDQARNFLGDTYYKDSNELHEGDELTLDKGVMVEVADAIGVTQTDLTPLFEKKPKEAPPPPSAPPRRFQPPSQVTRPQAAPPAHAARTNAQQMRHKSLNTLLGTPKGPIGKSVPIVSPFEARQEKEKENDFAVDRAAKRQKTTHTSTGSATLRLSSPVQEESHAPKKALPLWAKTADAKTIRRTATFIPPGAPVITLDELDAIAQASSAASVPSTPPEVVKTAARPAVTPAPQVKPVVVEKPVLQTPRIPRGKVPVPSVKALETPRVQAPTSSPPVSASNRLTNVDFAIQPTPAKEPIRRPHKQPSPQPPPQSLPPQSPPRNPKAKSLRLSKGVKRGTLMMFQAAPPLPRAEARVTTAKSKTSDVSRRGLSPPAPKPKRKTTDGDNLSKRAKSKSTPIDNPLDPFDDDQEVMHGFLDQQLLVSPTSPDIPPEPILVPDSPEPRLSRPKAAKQVPRNARKISSPKAKDSKLVKINPPPGHAPGTSLLTRKPVQKPHPAREPSPPAVPVDESVKIPGRAASPALSAVSDSRSRTTSLSPRKLAALSTGGFRKKSKLATPQPAAPDEPPTVPRNETLPLPPHPLRANKKGPVMTTTELAAMLQKPKTKSKPRVDPIEDDEPTTGKSPDRKFRRVRSENDAPIPSTSADWEKNNLPKPLETIPSASTEIQDPPPTAAKSRSTLAALVKKTDPRRRFARTQSLNLNLDVDTTVSAEGTESPLASPVVDKDVGPWSTEAFDLFDWRPPRSEV